MIFLENQQNYGLQEKTELFLEVYGNTLVRRQTSQYIEKMAHELILMVTDFEYMAKKLAFINLTQLKYKERDYLEGILKFWRNKEKKYPFEISKCWDLRLRQLLGVRYDSRLNVFDWDYNMELIERGGSIVYIRQYKDWRDTGVAFKIREGTYDVPNRTLASAMVFKLDGERFPRRGYWGDMLVSPYITFGVETEEKSFYKKQNNNHIKTAEDVSEFNITSLFYEFTNKQKYQLPQPEPQTEKSSEAPKLQEITEEDEEEQTTAEDGQSELENDVDKEKNNIAKDVELMDKKEAVGDTNDSNSLQHDQEPQENVDNLDKKEINCNDNKSSTSSETEKDDHEWMPLEDVEVVFLPMAGIEELMKKAKYNKLFNVVYFSNSMVHHLKPDLANIFADRCSVILETALFMLDIKKNTVQEFVKKISQMAEAAGCKPLEAWDDLQDSYIKFYFERGANP
ncbi:dynein axonemal assembly factor 3-like isoform X2 [Physella acuta]|nr:dynein axonemal assembly factor 3-like isoform X2 [Physella acuta]